jgi:putative NADH-flavin reductase
MTLVLVSGPGHAAEEAESDSLRILVYGATGKVGSHVVDEALSRGHIVTAVSRDPSRLIQICDNLSAVQSNILDPKV